MLSILLACAEAAALPVPHLLQRVCDYKQEFREGCVPQRFAGCVTAASLYCSLLKLE